MNALIVDDSLTVRMDLAEAFQVAGFHALPCATIAEARRSLDEEPVAVVILDVVLPDGDGVELLRELRSSPDRAGLPVLMLSSEAEVRDRIRGLSTGADEYVGKPYDTGYVIARARELVRAHGAAGGGIATPTVLVIDDSRTFREELRERLQAAGYRVVTAATGEEGLRLTADVRPSAVIVDGVLPGADGTTVIRRIRLDAALRHTPCLLLTASEDRSAELRALDAGADAFVRKDEDPSVVLARIGAVLRRAGELVSGDAATSLLGPRKILAVDDSATYLNEVASTLREEGYDVICARSGEEALELLAVQAVDCVLLDLVMPGMGGHQTCLRIKAAPAIRDIPLILLTAVDSREAMLEGLSAGADDYIAKSSDLEVLKARVRAQLRRRQFEDETRTIRDRLLQMELEAAEARAARELAQTRAALVEQLERKNRELEAFSYSVSHDLRAPLRTIDGFSRAALEDCGEALGPVGAAHLARVRSAAKRMSELIDDLLSLSRLSECRLRRQRVDLGAVARSVAEVLAQAHPDRSVRFEVAPGLWADADPGLLRVVLENLLGNAWKFTGKRIDAAIEVGTVPDEREPTFFVRDNGAGFNVARAERLFAPFQRMHSEQEFAGTGIGLATVQRIVDRHGGRVWADSRVGHGATFFFTLPAPSRELQMDVSGREGDRAGG